MKSTLFIISCIALLCSGCFEDKHFYEINIDEEVEEMDTMMMYGPDTAEIKLDFFVGQKILYRLSTFHGYSGDLWFEFNIKPDTLELEVIDQIGDTFLIKESFTPFSFLMLNPNVDYYEKHEESDYLNYWFIRNDSLILTKAPGTAPHSRDNNSHLLGRCCLYMRDFRDLETKIVGFKTRVPFSVADKEAFTRNYSLNGHHYDRLNIFINDYPTWRDDYGNTTVYSHVHGIVRGSRVEGWIRSTGHVWDRL